MTKKLFIFLSAFIVTGCFPKKRPPKTDIESPKIEKKEKTRKRETIKTNKFIFYYMNFSLASKRRETKRAEEFLTEALKIEPDNPELLLKGSMFFASVNRLEKAINLAEKAASIKDNPLKEKTLRLLGTLYIMKGNKEKAKEVYRKLTEISKNPKDFVIYGKLLLQESKTREAEKVIRKGIKIDNTNPTLHFLLGYTLFQEKNFKESEKELIKAAKLDPENENTYKLLLEIYKNNKSKKIKNFMEKAAQKNPSLPLLKELVKIYIISGEKEKAVKTLNRIVEMEPYNLKNLTEVATSLLELKEYSKVIPIIERITKLNPNNPNAYLMLGISYEITGEKDKAIKAYEKALDLFPENTTVMERLANIYAENNKIDEAKAYYERLYQLTKKPEYILKIAQIEADTGNINRAYKLLKKLAEENRTDEKILFSLAVISDKLDLENETVTYLKKVIEINPNNVAALNYLSYIYANRGENLEEAMKLIKKVLKLRPENPAYIDTYGWVLFKLRNYEKACKILEKAYKLSNKDPVVEEHLGECYYYTGKWDKAKELLKNAVQKMESKPKSIEGEKDILQRAKEILKRLK
ncbi:tetratricopeptide repeat protein [Desulfurobacterium atlanticum]|uniref:Flp pilus assembly protein TadD, contains TPR repeats n=1 Tax=Desulfurobacterium atlanticum TaxID=240169 RepID=A0A238YEZ1_9BACT|nr:tetratricopeptide repeat protein [Desulfurobacterium atlanticum]SNR69805.1 Flp pilus assembly protein TadD, contains TPR repeats [Desulfurobacterium atlanticum]